MIDAIKRMMEWQKKQMELQAQLDRDMKLAQDIYQQQHNLHGQSWNNYGAPELSKLEKERQEKLQETKTEN